jgi:hypothetical protein
MQEQSSVTPNHDSPIPSFARPFKTETPGILAGREYFTKRIQAPGFEPALPESRSHQSDGAPEPARALVRPAPAVPSHLSLFRPRITHSCNISHTRKERGTRAGPAGCIIISSNRGPDEPTASLRLAFSPAWQLWACASSWSPSSESPWRLEPARQLRPQAAVQPPHPSSSPNTLSSSQTGTSVRPQSQLGSWASEAWWDLAQAPQQFPWRSSSSETSSAAQRPLGRVRVNGRWPRVGPSDAVPPCREF